MEFDMDFLDTGQGYEFRLQYANTSTDTNQSKARF